MHAERARRESTQREGLHRDGRVRGNIKNDGSKLFHNAGCAGHEIEITLHCRSPSTRKRGSSGIFWPLTAAHPVSFLLRSAYVLYMYVVLVIRITRPSLCGRQSQIGKAHEAGAMYVLVLVGGDDLLNLAIKGSKQQRSPLLEQSQPKNRHPPRTLARRSLIQFDSLQVIRFRLIPLDVTYFTYPKMPDRIAECHACVRQCHVCVAASRQ